MATNSGKSNRVEVPEAKAAAAYVEKSGTKMDFEAGVTASMALDSAAESEG